MTSPSVSVCFPAYNEEATIRFVVEDAHRLLSASGIDYEILVCDDGSTDATGRIIEELAASIPRMRAMGHAPNRGIFVTFERLYGEATKAFVFLNSTDRQWDTALLFDLLPLTSSADVIVASRRNKHYGAARRVVSWAFNAAPRFLFGVTTYDAGAVKLMRREIIGRCPVLSASPFAEAERLIRAARTGYHIVEHPVDTAPRGSGRARGASWRLTAASALDMARLWIALRREQRGVRAARLPPAGVRPGNRGHGAHRQ